MSKIFSTTVKAVLNTAAVWKYRGFNDHGYGLD